MPRSVHRAPQPGLPAPPSRYRPHPDSPSIAGRPSPGSTPDRARQGPTRSRAAAPTPGVADQSGPAPGCGPHAGSDRHEQPAPPESAGPQSAPDAARDRNPHAVPSALPLSAGARGDPAHLRASGIFPVPDHRTIPQPEPAVGPSTGTGIDESSGRRSGLTTCSSSAADGHNGRTTIQIGGQSESCITWPDRATGRATMGKRFSHPP